MVNNSVNGKYFINGKLLLKANNFINGKLCLCLYIYL